MAARNWKYRLFPELDRFDDRRDAERALIKARAISGLYSTVLWIVPIAVVIVLLTEFLLVPRDLTWVGNALFWPTVVFFPSVCLWLRRRRVRLALRRELVDRGIPICLHCGYDTRDLPENRCPECGQAFEPIDSDS